MPTMRIHLKKTVLGVLLAVPAMIAVSATPALATDRVGCGDRTDFVMFNIDLGGGLGTNQCYANAGDIAVNIGNVYSFSSGNNKVTVNYEFGGRYYTSTLDRWQGVGFGDSRVRVYEVRVY
jgi:hypothetical protein